MPLETKQGNKHLILYLPCNGFYAKNFPCATMFKPYENPTRSVLSLGLKSKPVFWLPIFASSQQLHNTVLNLFNDTPFFWFCILRFQASNFSIIRMLVSATTHVCHPAHSELQLCALEVFPGRLCSGEATFFLTWIYDPIGTVLGVSTEFTRMYVGEFTCGTETVCASADTEVMTPALTSRVPGLVPTARGSRRSEAQETGRPGLCYLFCH